MEIILLGVLNNHFKTCFFLLPFHQDFKIEVKIKYVQNVLAFVFLNSVVSNTHTIFCTRYRTVKKRDYMRRKRVLGILSGHSKDEPLHDGEVFGVWSYMIANNGLLSIYQAFINHAGDKDLISMLEDAVKMMKEENKLTAELLKINGIALPPALPDRPVASAEEIPVGARFADPEISAILAMNSSQGLVACSLVMGQAIRDDIGMMFGQFHASKAMFGAKLLRMNKEKAWIVPPPLHYAPTSAN